MNFRLEALRLPPRPYSRLWEHFGTKANGGVKLPIGPKVVPFWDYLIEF